MEKQLWIVLPIVSLLALTAQADGGQWKTYTVADGLVSPDVTTIFQDRIGNLWFGTRAGGVSQFDGRDFRSFTKKDGLPGGSIKQILEDKRGHLWPIITPSTNPWEEGLVCRHDGMKFHKVTEQDGLPGGVSEAVLKDRSGNLWFANKYGLTRHDGTRFQHFGDDEFQQFISDQSGTDGQIYAMFESRNGDIWLGGGPGLRRRDGPRRMRQRGLPFVILYDGSKFHYSSLESLSESPFPGIHAIAEDDAGNIWFGGRSVLLKYDGKRFERFDGERQSRNSEGFTARIGTGEVLLTWKEPLGPTGEPLFAVSLDLGPGPPGRLERNRAAVSPEPLNGKGEDRDYRHQHRTVGVSIDSILKDSNSSLWFNSRGFISHWNGNEVQHFVIPGNWGEIEEQILLDEGESPTFYPGHVVLEDVEGNLWFKSTNGAHRFDGKSFQTFTVDDGLGSDNISVILQAMDGRFWFGHDSGVTVFDPVPPVIQNFTTRDVLGSNSVRSIHEDKQGFVWFTVRGGVARYDGEKMQYFSEEQMGDWHPELSKTTFPRVDANFAADILDGGEAGVWFVGNGTHQIFRYKDGVFRRYSIWRNRVRPVNRYDYRPGRFDALDNRVLAVDSEGNLWLAVGRSPIRCDGESFQLLTVDGFQVVPPNGRRDIRRGITDIHVDSQGNIWIAAPGEGVKRYDGASLKTFTTADGLRNNNIRRILEDRRGNLWYAGEQTLTNYDGRSFQSFSVTDATGPPVAIHQDVHGSISFIYPYTIARYDGGNFELVRSDEALIVPLGDKRVRASTTDEAGNLWLATSHGIIKYDGKQFTTYTTEDGLLVNDIRDVLEDRRGNLWCATWGGGVALYNGENFQAITTKHGLVHNNVRSVSEDSRGNMWFATDGGITKYMLRTDILPRIRLTKVIADDVYTEFDEELQLAAEVRRVVFEYQGISLQQTKLLYTHKLEGYDTDWSQPSAKKQVEYDRLKPGSYTFLVKALREGSAYSNPPVVLQLTIAPPFWMQSQFYMPTSIIGVTLAVFAFLISRLIAQRRRAAALRVELRQKEEAEIRRVKKELNDAREMQTGLLPKAAPHIDEFELAGVSLPATEVGGDFYDYLTLGNNLVGIALADVSGKGLRGAMNAVMANGMLHEVVQVESRADAILSRLNADLLPLLHDSMFTALNLGILNQQTKQIHYTNAGQPNPIIKRNGRVEEVELGGLPLGIIAEVTYDEKTVDLHPGDYVVFYTDGLTEAMNEAEEIYGSNRLKDAICNTVASLNAEEMIRHILQDIHGFMGTAEQYDDMTAVVLRYPKAV